tara:strand:+ start:2423 stop:2983 length:561 start_codon:yes stop_codon:yes gene_type:complete
MRTFREYSKLCEAYFDPNVQGRSQVKRVGTDGTKIGADRKKTAPERRRVKAVGGGKTAPAKEYKARKDIGSQRQQSKTVQQPTQARGSAALSAREAQRKAAMERRAAKSGVKTKTAAELLAKKTKKTVDSNYKPVKTSGLTTKERKAVQNKGEKALRDIRLKNLGKSKESELKNPITRKEIERRKK